MPHIRIEYSSNLDIHAKASNFLKALHVALPQWDASFKTSECRGRIVSCEAPVVADQTEDVGLIHVVIKIVEGRSEEVRVKVGQNIVDLLESHFRVEILKLKTVDLTVLIEEFKRINYFKQRMKPLA